MTNDLVRWTIGFALLAHGIGHVLFMPLLANSMRLQVSGNSWLLTPALGEGLTRLLATIAAAVALTVFLGAAGGMFAGAPSWRTFAVVGAVVSAVLVVIMWDGLPTSSAFFALAFDAVVLLALVVGRWPSKELVGA